MESTPPATYQAETLRTLWNELAPLADAHWREIHGGPGQFQPDRERYEAAEAAGILRLFTARDRSWRLLGYAAYAVGPDAHNTADLHATADAIYVIPEARSLGVGVGLIRHVHMALSVIGVCAVHHHVTPARDFSGLLERLGYTPSSTTYTLRLE